MKWRVRGLLVAAASLAMMPAVSSFGDDFSSPPSAFELVGTLTSGDSLVAASSAAVALPAVTATNLTSATPFNAVSSPTQQGVQGDGKPDLIYNPTTGDVIFSYDGYDPGAGKTLLELDIGSSKNSLNPNGYNPNAAGSISKSSSDIDYQNLGATPIADGVDLGTIFPINSTVAALVNNDISANFFVNGNGAANAFVDVRLAPEPTSLALGGLLALGAMARKRRQAR